MRKVLELAERKFGPPPVSYCWLSFGSEGRKEQTFKTDQDNAIVYADPADAGPGRGGAEVLCRLCALCPRRPGEVRIPALPGGLHGKQSEVVPAPVGLEEALHRLDPTPHTRGDPPVAHLLRLPTALRGRVPGRGAARVS